MQTPFTSHTNYSVRSLILAFSRRHLSGIKTLKNELTDLMRFRVSRFRIIYRIEQKEHFEIIAVGTRERIHEDTFRLIRKNQI